MVEDDQADVKDKEKCVCNFIERFHIPKLMDDTHFPENGIRNVIEFLTIFRKENRPIVCLNL